MENTQFDQGIESPTYIPARYPTISHFISTYIPYEETFDPFKKGRTAQPGRDLNASSLIRRP